MKSPDPEWISSTLDEYERPLMRYAAHITGDLERAREVVQDTFLKLCSQNPSKLRGHLPQWLYTVCRNRALDVRRKERKMTSIGEAEINRQPDPIAGPASILEQAEQMEQVLEAMKMLPANQQEVLRLKFQSELSYREISQITKMSIGNVGFLIHTALSAIRKEMQVPEGTKVLRRVK